MPLDFDGRHFIPLKVKQCNRDLREKDERIISLETENAILHLKLAQLQAELEREKSDVSSVKASLSTAKQKDSIQCKNFRRLQQQIKESKDELKSLRSAMVSLPMRVRGSVEDWALDQARRLQHNMQADSMDLKLLQHNISSMQSDLTLAQQKYIREKERRRELHNTLVELRGNIRVHCRVRPILDYDSVHRELQPPSSRHVDDKEEVVHVLDDESVSVIGSRPGHPQANRTFEFERVYNPRDSQKDVFTEVKPLLTSLLDGYNVCIMAYGQTGSGKTHSMLGGRYTQDLTQATTRTMLDESEEDGVVPRAARELFRLLREKPNTYNVEVSVVEVYNNEICDLLTLNPASSRHDLFTGDDGSMEVTSLTQRPVTTAVEIVDLVRHGITHRHEDATQVHAHSSRSHLVVTLTVTVIQSPSHRPSSRVRSQSPSLSSSFRDEHEVVRTKLQLVDLAGSECVGMSGVTGSALRETSHINRSLSALADVLTALAEGRGHVPYRNSRLTHLMKDSIGGDAKLLVVCCVSPTHRYLTETLQCLGFGSRARQIQRGPIKKRPGAVLSGAGDQSPIISGRGRQGQRHSIPASSESSIPVPKFRTSPMTQRRSSSLDSVPPQQKSGRASPGKPR